MAFYAPLQNIFIFKKLLNDVWASLELKMFSEWVLKYTSDRIANTNQCIQY